MVAALLIAVVLLCVAVSAHLTWQGWQEETQITVALSVVDSA